jgi:hypothetical protein
VWGDLFLAFVVSAGIFAAGNAGTSMLLSIVVGSAEKMAGDLMNSGVFLVVNTIGPRD